jgi:hypothetical protein
MADCRLPENKSRGFGRSFSQILVLALTIFTVRIAEQGGSSQGFARKSRSAGDVRFHKVTQFN